MLTQNLNESDKEGSEKFSVLSAEEMCQTYNFVGELIKSWGGNVSEKYFKIVENLSQDPVKDNQVLTSSR